MSKPSSPLFEKVPSELDFPKEEKAILALWKERKIFERSLEKPASEGSFVFYEGPPTANGLPHNGHVLTRVIKDLFPRYKTMRGYHVPRKAGWDTHGLPVEVEVEKELRIHGKAAIEDYGVEPFVAKCIQSVFRYTDEWEKLTDRVGFWVDLKSAYVTYHKSYVESVWWALSELFKKGLLYQGHKVVWWWAQGGTALSSGEVGLGYKQVDDPSVYVAFPLQGEDASLLVWTTTPWTLPSNMYAAVQANYDYVRAKITNAKDASIDGRVVIVAKGLVETLQKKLSGELVIEREMKGAELVGKKYTPPFDLFARDAAEAPVRDKVWSVIHADFVTLDSGTGIVHIAPAFGEDDFNAHKKLYPGVAVTPFCAVKSDGTFVDALPKYAGRWVKDADKDISKELAERGLLVHAETYRHDYPFCWRSDNDPLIQYARPAWYIRTTEKIDQAIANNQAVHWLPEHIKDGRFGDFLANNVDWALSRERYWGTPLNIWINDVSGAMEAPSSVDEILKKNPRAFDHFHAAKKADPSLSDHLIVHKPWIDQVTWENQGEAGVYRRVPEVIDCWFDSGCMPFAQWGFPHTGVEQFKQSFPADFISEAIDQTRGWFYSLLMISTLLFDDETQKRFGLADHREAAPGDTSSPGLEARPFPHPYKTCIVLGHVSDKEGKKESKSKGNYTPPDVILDDVRMEFAVLDESQAKVAFKFKESAKAGQVFIADEDLQGLDLEHDATVELIGANGEVIIAKAARAKGLPRRVAVVDAETQKKLALKRTTKVDVKPVEVPWLPEGERITIRDPHSPAPGADAFRWFFYASNPPWSATRHALSNVRALQKEFLIKLRNVYSFFTIYANIDGFDPFDPKNTEVAHAKRHEIDRWILSELAATTRDVTADLDAYDVYAATGKLTSFVDALSNWYVRRCRERFWRAADVKTDDDKKSAYQTLYTSLVTLAELIAPFVPFLAETMFQNLVAEAAKKAGKTALESVHLASFPKADEAKIDPALMSKMRAVRDLVSLGLQVRTQSKLKVRQPLRTATIVLAKGDLWAMLEALEKESGMIKDELNVLNVKFVDPKAAAEFVEYKLKPNFRTLGQRGLGKEAQELKKQMGALGAEEASRLHVELMTNAKVTFGGVELLVEDVEVSILTKGAFAAAGSRVGMVILDTALDDELRELGFARELVNRLQTARKELGLEYTDRIRVGIVASDRVTKLIDAHKSDVAKEVLANEIAIGEIADVIAREVDVEGESVKLWVARA